jgi:citronellol/citronellal dehydrogenase
MKLKNKVCIVTGASRGIGKAIALGFAREGADVVIAARTEVQKDERLPGTIHTTAEQVRALGRRALPVKVDVSKEEDVDRMVALTLQEFGRLDVMVHNAAVAFWRKLWETPTKLWDLVISVNLRGAFLCAKAVLPHMIKQRSGSIINISSPGADIGGKIDGGMAYSASKAAIERLSNGLAEEVREYGIAVNSLKPAGFVDSEGARYWSPPGTDFSKWEPPDLMVKATIFLATQTSAGVTGGIFTEKELAEKYNLD